MEITIVGAGAIGGTVGAYLARAGHAVTFVDAAADHVRAINAEGLTVEGFVPTFTVPARALLPDEVRGPLGTVFLAVKAMHTEAATRRIAPHLAPDGYAVSIQNGFNEDVIAAIVGRERTVGAFVNFGADYLEPGRIFYGGAGSLYLGELDGRITDRLRALQAALRQFLPATWPRRCWPWPPPRASGRRRSTASSRRRSPSGRAAPGMGSPPAWTRWWRSTAGR